MTKAGEIFALKDIEGLSGLECMTRIANGQLPQAPIAKAMNFWMVSAADGETVFEGEPGLTYRNPMGSVHGGWYGSILDSALGCAVHTKMAVGQAYTTLEYKVNITRAIKPGTRVRAVATVSHCGRSTAVAEAKLTGVDDGKLYATGSTTCILLNG